MTDSTLRVVASWGAALCGIQGENHSGHPVKSGILLTSIHEESFRPGGDMTLVSAIPVIFALV